MIFKKDVCSKIRLTFRHLTDSETPKAIGKIAKKVGKLNKNNRVKTHIVSCPKCDELLKDCNTLAYTKLKEALLEELKPLGATFLADYEV